MSSQPPSITPIEVAYSAETHGCTYLLDDQGFCRRVVLRGANLKEASLARRCVGAQYVATLDLASARGLVQMPQPGAPLLFARIDDGRVSLVKTAPLRRWIDHTFRNAHEVTTARYAGHERPDRSRPAPTPEIAVPPPADTIQYLHEDDDDYLAPDDKTQPKPMKPYLAATPDEPDYESDFEEEVVTIFADKRTLYDAQAPPPPETDEVEVEDAEDGSPTKYLRPGVGKRKKGMLPKRR